jgi:hypothetical protein
MSEKMYALLLRLYPSRFRKAYGEEALQLFRDRARDERGFLSGLRLWLDLLGDLAVSIPRQYRSVPAAVVVSSVRHFGDGTPSFHILEDETLSFGSLLYGGIASLVVYSCILFVLSHGRSQFPVGDRSGEWAARYSAAASSGRGAADEDRVAASGAAKPTPTIALSYMPAHDGARSTVSLTATVSAVGTGPAPTGNVRFFDGTTVLNTVMLRDGSITVERKMSVATVHSFRVLYCGDDNYGPVFSSDGSGSIR